jgi:hypothetical protein
MGRGLIEEALSRATLRVVESSVRASDRARSIFESSGYQHIVDLQQMV